MLIKSTQASLSVFMLSLFVIPSSIIEEQERFMRFIGINGRIKEVPSLVLGKSLLTNEMGRIRDKNTQICEYFSVVQVALEPWKR